MVKLFNLFRFSTNKIYTVRKIVDKFVSAGNTVNLCAIDLSKAFDKVNHNALYIKLMERHIPVELLDTLFSLFSNCWTCIKWKNISSCFFQYCIWCQARICALTSNVFTVYQRCCQSFALSPEILYCSICGRYSDSSTYSHRASTSFKCLWMWT